MDQCYGPNVMSKEVVRNYWVCSFEKTWLLSLSCMYVWPLLNQQTQLHNYTFVTQPLVHNTGTYNLQISDE